MFSEKKGAEVVFFDCQRRSEQTWRPLLLSKKELVLEHKGGKCLSRTKKRGFVLADCAPYTSRSQRLELWKGDLPSPEQASSYFKDPKKVYLE